MIVISNSQSTQRKCLRGHCVRENYARNSLLFAVPLTTFIKTFMVNPKLWKDLISIGISDM